MIIIGSQAIKYWFPDFPREPKDWDVILNQGEHHNLITEQRIEVLPNPVILEYCKDYNQKYLKPNELYTLKVSHLFWDIGWEKHMFDVQFLKEKGCILDTCLFQNLYNYWNEYHSKNKRSDLKMSAEDFFNNALTSKHSHDWLHTLIKNPPTYTKVLKDGAEVEVSEEKFFNLTEEEKEDLVREEVIIMAYERYSKLDYRSAWSKMIKKFIISHAPLWEAIWIIENFKSKTLYKPSYNFIEYLNNKINGR